MPGSGSSSDGAGDRNAPVSLDPVLHLGGPPYWRDDVKPPAPNALFLPIEAVARLGKRESYMDRSVAGGERGWECVKEAALVLATGECQSDCKSERSELCARYLLDLRYVLAVKTDHNDDSENERSHGHEETYRGRATLFSLTDMKPQPVLAFAGSSTNGAWGDTAMARSEYVSPIPDARITLGKRLAIQFPGATTPEDWAPKKP
jgi:hypothetical protein